MFVSQMEQTRKNILKFTVQSFDGSDLKGMISRREGNMTN